jgi:tetratricopeptide (TPR) repeat protein
MYFVRCSRIIAAMAVFTTGTAFAQQAAAPQKNYQNQGEYEIYNEVTKDYAGNNFTKAIADLDTWKEKYPVSDYGGDREVWYVKSYMAAKQYGKAVDQAGELLSKGLDSVFSNPKEGPGQMLQILWNATVAVPVVVNPTAEQLATGDKVARRLMAFDRTPDGVSDADWTKLKSDLQGPAKAALLYLAIFPGNQAMTKQPRDCAAAEVAYAKALADYPDSSTISFNMGMALSCLKKNAAAIYAFERAAVLDPTLGGTKDAKQTQSYADGAYTRVHGSDEGLEQLKQQVKQSPLPPAGFAIKTATQILEEKEAEFENGNPQLALWMKIKGALADANGPEYFESQLKNSAVPQLRGTLVAAKPACRPKELLVAFPLPDAPQPLQAEITLKLDKPLGGKPEVGTEFHWEGVPISFVQSPFMLTMEADTAKIELLKSAACAAAAPRTGVTKKK